MRLISEAGNREKNVEETEEIKMYIEDKPLTVADFTLFLLEDGMMPIFIIKES